MADSEIPPSTRQQVNATPKNRASRKKPPKPPLDPPLGPEIPPPPPHGKESTTCKPDQIPAWKILLETIGLAALIIYAGYTIMIYGANHDAAVAAQNTLCEIQKQTSLMQTQVEASMAAVLSKQFRISWPESQRAYLSVILDNRGRVVASKISGHIEITEVSVRDERIARRTFQTWNFTAPDINPSTDLPPEKGTNLDISEEELSGATAMPNALRLTGTITYFNGFHERSEELCYYIPGKAIFRNKAGAIQNTYAENPMSCGAMPDQIGLWRQLQAQTGSQ